jgi:hypothetical protein
MHRHGHPPAPSSARATPSAASASAMLRYEAPPPPPPPPRPPPSMAARSMAARLPPWLSAASSRPSTCARQQRAKGPASSALIRTRQAAAGALEQPAAPQPQPCSLSLWEAPQPAAAHLHKRHGPARHGPGQAGRRRLLLCGDAVLEQAGVEPGGGEARYGRVHAVLRVQQRGGEAQLAQPAWGVGWGGERLGGTMRPGRSPVGGGVGGQDTPAGARCSPLPQQIARTGPPHCQPGSCSPGAGMALQLASRRSYATDTQQAWGQGQASEDMAAATNRCAEASIPTGQGSMCAAI